jgi:GDP-4-dehydro-6-deoxy-D-mannose reductase
MAAEMRAVVTGAHGFVGKHLCRYLRSQGDQVTEVGGPPVGPIDHDGFSIDVTEPDGIRDVLEEVRPDAVFHLAGFSSVRKSHATPAQAFAVNGLGAVHLLAAARDLVPKARILLIGSAEVYGAVPTGIRASEDSPLTPLSPYASSKLAAEVAGFQFFRAYRLEVISPRPFNHLGKGQDPTFVVPSLARQIDSIRLGRSPPVLKAGDLTVVRDFSHVSDVVEAYRLLAVRGEPGQAYNVCSGEGRTIRSVLDEMLELSGVRPRIEVDSSLLRPNDVPSSIGDPTKLLRLGWTPSRSIKDALRDVLAEAASVR